MDISVNLLFIDNIKEIIENKRYFVYHLCPIVLIKEHRKILMRSIILIVIFYSVPFFLFGQGPTTICETTGNGVWDSAATWRDAKNPSQPCPCANGFPGTAINANEADKSCPERVIIREGHTVTLGQADRWYYNGELVIFGSLIFDAGTSGGPQSAQLIMNSTSTVTIAPTGSVAAVGQNTNQTNNNFITIGSATINGTAINNANSQPKPNQLSQDNLTGGGCSATGTAACDNDLINEIITNPLPITLGSISYQVAPNSIIIHFTTTKEENFSHFEIQRSRDGRSWEVIGEVKGHGNTTEVQAYAFEDRLPLAGLSYYRLNAIDIDGTQEYHGMLSVLFNPGEQSINIYPNPVTSGRFSLQASFELRQGAKIRVLDMVGAEILTEVYDGFANEFILPARVKSGLYVVLISQDGITYQKKLLVK